MRTTKTDQTGRMPRLIWVFTARTLILLVLSCRGSNKVEKCYQSLFWCELSICLSFCFAFGFLNCQFELMTHFNNSSASLYKYFLILLMECDCKSVSQTWLPYANVIMQFMATLFCLLQLLMLWNPILGRHIMGPYHEQFISMDLMVIGQRRNSGLAMCLREQGINQILISGNMEQKRTFEENRTIEISSIEKHTGYECTSRRFIESVYAQSL